ncbi:MAG: DNA adenine methyltransferase YhdJ [Promethearchaeota archaeon]|nr:MAG: DNA adenine methyltransferase YhdJ [Candidatus Lokiarchaeota archaeon]
MVNLVWDPPKNPSRIKKKEAQVQWSEHISPPIIEAFEKEKVLKSTRVEKHLQSSENEWENKLIWGENLAVMTYLLPHYKERIDLIYIDPPFFTKSEFYYKVFIGTSKKSFKKTAYDDRWSNGMDSYLDFMYKRLCVIKDLLSERGSIYLHIDWHISHYIKVLMDKVFGSQNFRNEIIWHYPAASAQTKRFFVRSYDSILFYTKSDKYIFNDDPNIYMEYSDRVKNALQKDKKGYFYLRGGSHDGKKLSRKVYVTQRGIFPRDVWTEIPYIRANTQEYQGFSTQKPERLLKRIILASTTENSTIADFFCGTGTTLAVAEKLQRRWLGCDLNWHAVYTSHKRLLSLSESNSILNWDNSYDKPSHQYKIISLQPQRLTLHLTKKVVQEESINEAVMDPSKLNLKVEQKEDQVRITLEHYDCPYLEILKKTIQNKIQNWKELIDYYAVDFLSQENKFNPQWISYRTPKKRDIILTTGWYEYESLNKQKITIKVKITDIFGLETIKTISLN